MAFCANAGDGIADVTFGIEGQPLAIQRRTGVESGCIQLVMAGSGDNADDRDIAVQQSD